MAPEEMELPDTRREVSSLVIKAYVVSLLLLLSVLVWSVGDAWAQYAHNLIEPTSDAAMPLKALIYSMLRKAEDEGAMLSLDAVVRLACWAWCCRMGGFSFCKLLVTRMKIVIRSPYSQTIFGKRAGGNGPCRGWT